VALGEPLLKALFRVERGRGGGDAYRIESQLARRLLEPGGKIGRSHRTG
jgi:hypothetical protein